MLTASARTLRAITCLLVLFLLTFSTTLAQDQTLTQQRVVQLLQLKTPENEVIEQIKKSGTIFVLGEEDIARLKRNWGIGVSVQILTHSLSYSAAWIARLMKLANRDGIPSWRTLSQCLHKLFAVLFIEKNRFPAIAPRHHMIEMLPGNRS